MRNRYTDRLRIGVSAHGITLLHTGGWFKKHSTVLADRAWPEHALAAPEQMAARLRSMLTEYKCERLSATIVLSDALVRLWSVTPPQNSARLSDCQAATALRFQTLYGEPMTDWELAADWDARQPFLACAMPRPLLRTIEEVAREHQLTLLEIAPQFIAAWNRWRAEIGAASWFGVLHDEVLSIGAIHQRRLCAVRAAPLPADALDDRGWLPRHLQREALRLNLDMPAEIQLCGPIPEPWVSRAAGALRCTRLDAHRIADGAPFSAGIALAHAGT